VSDLISMLLSLPLLAAGSRAAGEGSLGLLASGGLDGCVKLWDLQDMSCTRVLHTGCLAELSSLALLTELHCVVTGVCVWENGGGGHAAARCVLQVRRQGQRWSLAGVRWCSFRCVAGPVVCAGSQPLPATCLFLQATTTAASGCGT
jgi:hypothetical protein